MAKPPPPRRRLPPPRRKPAPPPPRRPAAARPAAELAGLDKTLDKKDAALPPQRSAIPAPPVDAAGKPVDPIAHLVGLATKQAVESKNHALAKKLVEAMETSPASTS